MNFVQEFQNTVEKQKCIIENKNNCNDIIQHLKLDMITVKNNLNSLITKINDLRTKIMFIGSNNVHHPGPTHLQFLKIFLTNI